MPRIRPWFQIQLHDQPIPLDYHCVGPVQVQVAGQFTVLRPDRAVAHIVPSSHNTRQSRGLESAACSADREPAHSFRTVEQSSEDRVAKAPQVAFAAEERANSTRSRELGNASPWRFGFLGPSALRYLRCADLCDSMVRRITGIARWRIALLRASLIGMRLVARRRWGQPALTCNHLHCPAAQPAARISSNSSERSRGELRL